MKKLNNIKKVFDIKNLVKSLLALSFSCFYVFEIKLGAEMCEIDEKYAVYVCCAFAFFIFFKYLYNVTVNFLLSEDNKDGDKS